MFKILSLDGGGIRGAFIAAYLARIQQNLDRPLVDYFDLIAGTSTGGLIAVALGMGVPPDEIKEFYQAKGPEIFARPPNRLPAWKRRAIDACLNQVAVGIDAEWLFRCKFESGPLRTAIQKRLQNRLLGEAATRLAIPATDLTTAQGTVFKTPHRPRFIRDRYFTACDVIMATTAAPTYFPTVSIGHGSAYCDGGIWANNPAVVAYVEAVKISQECDAIVLGGPRRSRYSAPQSRANLHRLKKAANVCGGTCSSHPKGARATQDNRSYCCEARLVGLN
jgi:patatin-like phospholipase/acyl hydrolase